MKFSNSDNSISRASSNNASPSSSFDTMAALKRLSSPQAKTNTFSYFYLLFIENKNLGSVY